MRAGGWAVDFFLANESTAGILNNARPTREGSRGTGGLSVTKTKNAGIFGLLLFMLLTGCDFVEPDDQFQLGPDFQIQLGVPKARYGKSRFHPENLSGLYASGLALHTG